MSCFRPLQALRLEDGSVRVLNSVQALQLVSNPNRFPVPCGKCVGCRLNYSRSWAVRCSHEADLYEYNSFITLTYNDYYNERNGFGLNYRDFELFLKRLRKALDTQYSDYAFLTDFDNHKLRYFMCGEYGSKTFRPHFHALFFNLDFYDKVLHTERNGFKLYTSDTLSSFWTDPVTKDSYGYAVLGSVTVASTGYVSRYCVKKALQGSEHVLFNHQTGEFLPREKTNMSRKPGIALEWFKRYHKSVYPGDMVVMPGGKKFKPPRYYDVQLEKLDPVLFDAIKQSRLEFASSPKQLANTTVERLIVREAIQLEKLELLPRFL